MKKQNNIPYLLFFLLLCVCGCTKDSTTPPIPEMAQRTVILYFQADNNLSESIHANMEEAFKAKFDPTEYNVILFIDHNQKTDKNVSTHPQILRLTGNGRFEKIKEWQETNSYAVGFVKNVVQEVVEKFPAKEYGLVFSSHGNGWYYATEGRSLGNDEIGDNDIPLKDNNSINIHSIAEALPNRTAFVLFDACTMSTGEVAFQLSEKADVLIASPYIQPGGGFNFEKAVPKLLSGDYVGMASEFMDFYKQTDNVAMTVIDLKKFQEAVQLRKTSFLSWNVSSADLVPLANEQLPQHLGMYDEDYQYDYVDLIDKLAAIHGKQSESKALVDKFKASILFEEHTPARWYWDEGKQAYAFSMPTAICNGLSVFLPFGGAREDDLNYLKTLKWYNASGYDLFLD